jgi:nicotinate-nucleotide--dimethylbenzimidazole phosphoribosyltransferase
VGAGAPPVGEHRRRPPIPIAGVDAPAREAARARGASVVAVWAAGVTGADPPRVVARVFAATEAGDLTAASSDGQRAPLGVVHIDRSVAPARDTTREAAMSVGEVALAVDTGRELAAQAARDGVTVVVVASAHARDAGAGRALSGALTGVAAAGSDAGAARALAFHAEHIAGPLGALRRLGTPAIAVLCGVALGAGEHGLGCVCDGLAGTAAGAVAAAIEPDLRARLIAAGPAGDPAQRALADHLALPAILTEPAAGSQLDGQAATAAIAALHAAAGDSSP